MTRMFAGALAAMALLAGCPALPPAPPVASAPAYVAPRATLAEVQALTEPMLVVDVRAADVFEIQHAKGAVNVPWYSSLFPT